jgi:monovalent cation/hydrogen antiporter
MATATCDDEELVCEAFPEGAGGMGRATLVDLRARGLIGDDAFHRVEEELDWAEVNAETMARAD